VAGRRFQTGQLYKKGKRRKVWIARWREDVLLPDGTIGRVRRGILPGSVAGLPTRRDAQVRLDERLRTVNQGALREGWLATRSSFERTVSPPPRCALRGAPFAWILRERWRRRPDLNRGWRFADLTGS
jgi:hypothetical protein